MAQGHWRRGSIATATFAAVLVTLVAAGGGCGIVIGADVPDFECLGTTAAECPGNQVCDTISSHHCIAPCSLTGCKGGTQCDPTSSLCVGVASDDGPTVDEEASTTEGGPDADATTAPDEAAPPAETGPTETSGPCRSIGCKCSGGTDCDSGICADQLSVTSGVWSAAGSAGFCTSPCCTSNECAAGSVCFATAAGGNYCVDPSWVQRSTALGTGLGGATCATGRDCRSGLCAGTTCADTCCSTGQAGECSGSDVCSFGDFPGAVTYDKSYVAMCAHGGTGQNGANCSHNSDCESELCDATQFGNCRNACRNTADCGGGGVSCAYITVTGDTGVVAACFPGAGNTPEGSSCQQDGDCQSQFCNPTSKECTDVCFADSDCTKSGWRCRPEVVTVQAGGSFSVLACGT